MKRKSLTEQVAIVSGGGTGVGRSFAQSLAQAGASVVIASRREEVLRQTAAELNSQFDAERVFSYVLDIRDLEQINALSLDRNVVLEDLNLYSR